MRRSHLLTLASIAASTSFATLLVAACGDSVTGVDTGGGTGTDAGSAAPDTGSSFTPSPTPTAIADADVPDTANIDGGLPTLSDLTIDFGQVDCGTTGTAKTLTLQNPGRFDLPWSAALGRGDSSPFAITPASGTLEPGGAVSITVSPKPVPQVSSTAANAFGDVITFSLGATFASVQLRETAHGAVLSYSPATLPFGNSPVGATTPAQADFAISNGGNAPAAITLATSGDSAFALVGSATLTANPGATASKVSFAPTDLVGYNGAVSMTVDPQVPLCAALPANMTITGSGTNDVLSVSPPSILFGNAGLVDCGATAATQKVRITNSSSAAVSYSTTLDRGAAAFTATPATGSVPANGFVDINVTPKAIPASTPTTPEAFSDTLTITTTAAGDTPHAVALHQTAHGAILTRSTNSVGFSNVAVGRTATTQFSFANTGNVDISVALQNGLGEFVEDSPVTISAGGFAAPNVKFTPSGLQPFSDIGTVTMATTVPLCGSLPSTLTLSGTGVQPTITAQPPSFSFGFIPCGTQAAPLTIKVTNNGPDTTFNANMEKGTLRFTVAPASGAISAGGFVNLVVTPQLIPQTSPVSANFFGDVLDVISGNGNLSVTLTQTAQGAIIDYNSKTSNAFPSTNNGTTSVAPVTVRNNGNYDALVTFSTTSSALGAFTSDPTSLAITAGTTPTVNIDFTPPGPGTVSYTGTWFAQTTTVLCNPMPAPITLTGSGK